LPAIPDWHFFYSLYKCKLLQHASIMKDQKEKDSKKQSTCIVGIGNTLRSDDGVGDYVCQLIDAKQLPGVSTTSIQQLDTTITATLVTFHRVIFVDASVNAATVLFQPLATGDEQPQSFSHHVNAAMISGLAEKLYSANTQFYICAIGATNFEMGNQLSEKTCNNAHAAVSLLTEWILLNSGDE
jgi:hydrogenase maturation protease